MFKKWLRLGLFVKKSTPASLLLTRFISTSAGVHSHTPAPVHHWCATFQANTCKARKLVIDKTFVQSRSLFLQLFQNCSSAEGILLPCCVDLAIPPHKRKAPLLTTFWRRIWFQVDRLTKCIGCGRVRRTRGHLGCRTPEGEAPSCEGYS